MQIKRCSTTPVSLAAALGLSAGLMGCSATPTAAERPALDRDAQHSLAWFLDTEAIGDAGAESAAGYAVFPSIGKGGAGLGVAFGRGVLFDGGGEMLGYASMLEGSAGLQLGGRSYTEVVVFDSEQAIEAFKTGQAELVSQAGLVLGQIGGTAMSEDREDVGRFFVLDEEGMMLDLTVGRQKFRFEPAQR